MRKYAITLTFQSGGMLQLPVLPEKLKVSSPGKNKTATVLGIGEVLLLHLKGLRSVSWDSFFPASSAPYVTGSIIPPAEAVRAIQSARDSREPIQFILSGSDLDMNVQMGVEDFSYDERFGSVGDIYYSIKLSEWKDYSPRRLILSDGGTKTAAAETPKERSGAAPAAPKTYTVAAGDSLWAISKRMYGSGSKWTEIYSANKGTSERTQIKSTRGRCLPSHDFSVSEQPDGGCLRHHGDGQRGKMDYKTPRLPCEAGTERSVFSGCCLGRGRDRDDA